jgi:plastocyanin
MRVRIAIIGFTLAAVAAAACSSGGSSNSLTGPTGTGAGGTGTGTTGAGAGESSTITASSTTTGGSYGTGGNYFFSPTPDTVAAGTVVTFQFGSLIHNVVFMSGPNPPANIPGSSNTSVQRTFTTAGTYNYQCTIHGFSGVLVVK